MDRSTQRMVKAVGAAIGAVVGVAGYLGTAAPPYGQREADKLADALFRSVSATTTGQRFLTVERRNQVRQEIQRKCGEPIERRQPCDFSISYPDGEATIHWFLIGR